MWFKQRSKVSLRGFDNGSPSYRIAKVYYDDWGQPFINEDTWSFHFSVSSRQILNEDGTTSKYNPDTEWKHVSGPSVRFDIKETEW